MKSWRDRYNDLVDENERLVKALVKAEGERDRQRARTIELCEAMDRLPYEAADLAEAEKNEWKARAEAAEERAALLERERGRWEEAAGLQGVRVSDLEQERDSALACVAELWEALKGALPIVEYAGGAATWLDISTRARAALSNPTGIRASRERAALLEVEKAALRMMNVPGRHRDGENLDWEDACAAMWSALAALDEARKP